MSEIKYPTCHLDHQFFLQLVWNHISLLSSAKGKKKVHEEKVQVSAVRYDSNMTKGLCYVARSLLNQKKNISTFWFTYIYTFMKEKVKPFCCKINN
jgi:hypothetical protein